MKLLRPGGHWPDRFAFHKQMTFLEIEALQTHADIFFPHEARSPHLYTYKWVEQRQESSEEKQGSPRYFFFAQTQTQGGIGGRTKCDRRVNHGAWYPPLLTFTPTSWLFQV